MGTAEASQGSAPGVSGYGCGQDDDTGDSDNDNGNNDGESLPYHACRGLYDAHGSGASRMLTDGEDETQGIEEASGEGADP